MAVTVKRVAGVANGFQQVLYKKEFIEQIARELVASQCEAFIEMSADFPQEYSTYESFSDMLVSGVKESTAEQFDDLITEFRDRVFSAIEDTKVKVVSATFNDGGIVDAEVTVGE